VPEQVDVSAVAEAEEEEEEREEEAVPALTCGGRNASRA
jgi:hypothetical protein